MVLTRLGLNLIGSGSEKPTDSIEIDAKATVSELKKVIFTQSEKFQIRPFRQRLYLIQEDKSSKPIILEDEQTLSSYRVKDSSLILIKDLGPQIRWKTVFIIEYLGPLIIHQLYLAYHITSKLSFTQILAYSCLTFHFLKREYETLFIHRFSHATMPLRNLFKNSAHYWILSGVGIGHFLYKKNYVPPSRLYILLGFLGFIIGEIGNLYTHVMLRNLRPPGTTVRKIPKGFGFNLVSCPNYLFEAIAWGSFSIMTGLLSAWLFTAVASVQMWMWAVKKHKLYLKEFPNYPKNRKPMIPYLC